MNMTPFALLEKKADALDPSFYNDSNAGSATKTWPDQSKFLRPNGTTTTTTGTVTQGVASSPATAGAVERSKAIGSRVDAWKKRAWNSAAPSTGVSTASPGFNEPATPNAAKPATKPATTPGKLPYTGNRMTAGEIAGMAGDNANGGGGLVGMAQRGVGANNGWISPNASMGSIVGQKMQARAHNTLYNGAKGFTNAVNNTGTMIGDAASSVYAGTGAKSVVDGIGNMLKFNGKGWGG